MAFECDTKNCKIVVFMEIGLDFRFSAQPLFQRVSIHRITSQETWVRPRMELSASFQPNLEHL